MIGRGTAGARVNSMIDHPEVPQNSPAVAHSSRLLLSQHSVALNPLESTLPQLFIPNNLKSFRINTYTKTIGGLSLPILPPDLKFTRKETSPSAFLLFPSYPRDPRYPRPPIFRRFLQVPYALTPLFATLTKIAGVYLVSSHSGTRHRIVLPLRNPHAL